MRMNRIAIAPFITLLVLILAISTSPIACEPMEKIRVIVTAPVLKSVVKAVGGDLVEVKSILPPGVDPHSYEPSIEDVVKTVSNASLIVMTGPHHLPIEEKIEKLAEEGLIKVPIINYEDYEVTGLTILKIPETGAENPHGYFYSISGLKAIAKACAIKLSKIDPRKSEQFEKNLEEYLQRLTALEERIAYMRVSGEKIILGGPILQYLAEDLDLEIVDIIVPAHGLEPSSKDISEAIQLVRGGKAQLVIISDREAAEYPALIKAFRENEVPFAIVPVMELSDTPELLPLVTASLLKSNLHESLIKYSPSTSFADAVLMPSLIANLVLAIFVILLLIKVRRYGGS